MGLTVGTGPFAKEPAGRFNFEVETPTGSVLLWDPVPHRIRAIVAGETVVDSTRAVLLHETGHLPVYYFPREDVRDDLLERTDKKTHCPHKGEASYWTITVGDRVAENAVWGYEDPLEPASFLDGYVALYWNEVDEWLAEEEHLVAHPRDPYSRIDVYPSSRRVRILLDGEVLADSERAQVLFETGLPPRYYFPPEDVGEGLLEPSSKQTTCAYKGHASHWHVRSGDGLHEDLAWSYAEPLRDGERVRGLIAFYTERVDVELDGEVSDRPVTQWSQR
ncbi:MAG TPA: DUF427 domain-containing protein [Gaiellaceae bacterium]|jgi:uncharacterized protein (DUF427 family)